MMPTLVHASERSVAQNPTIVATAIAAIVPQMMRLLRASASKSATEPYRPWVRERCSLRRDAWAEADSDMQLILEFCHFR
jgi:hypothetical protein